MKHSQKWQIRKFHDEGLKVARDFQNVPTELVKLIKSKDGMFELWRTRPLPKWPKCLF